ncbi:uncharacterized protein VP01_4715g1, partial [Puccinia sorghi]
DWSGSTKNFHKHLLKVHKLVDPKSSKKIEKAQTDIAKWIKNANLVPRKSFQELVWLLNEQSSPLVSQLSRHNISNHLSRVYLQTQEKIKIKFFAKQENLSFTQDVWTAPNVTAFMRVTVHFINKDFKMHHLTVSIPRVQGNFHLIILPPYWEKICRNYNRERFQQVVKFAQPELHESWVQFCCLNIEISTQWKFTFQMIQCVINLFPSCEHFFSESQELSKYHQSPAEWGQAANSSPSAKQLKSSAEPIQHGLENQSLLIQPATLVKSDYVCAMILHHLQNLFLEKLKGVYS